MISQLRAAREIVEPADSIPPLAVVDPKGKVTRLSSSYLRRKGRKLRPLLGEH